MKKVTAYYVVLLPLMAAAALIIGFPGDIETEKIDKSEEWYEDGTIMSVVEYENGEKVKSKKWDTDGELVE